MKQKITSAVRRSVDECGIIDTMRSQGCDAAGLARLNKMLREGKLSLTPAYGWGEMTHCCRVGGRTYHVILEDATHA